MKKIAIILCLLSFNVEAQTSVLKVADSLLILGNYKEALVKLEEQKKPTFNELKKIAIIYQKIGNYSSAIDFYKKAFSVNSTEKVKEEIGKCYQALGNAEKAINIYNEVLQTNPNNLLLKYQLVKLYMSNRKTASAEKLLNELIIIDTNNPNYYYQLGEIYNKQKKDASKGYLKAYQLDTTHIKSIYGLATFFKAVKVRDSSELFINKGLQLFPKSLNFLQLKAQNEYAKKEYDSTLVYLKKLEQLKFETLFTLKLFGLSYYNLKEYDKALIYLRKAGKKDFSNSAVDYSIGLTFFELKEYNKAEMSFLMSIIKEEPKLGNNYYQLAMTQLEQKKIKKAIQTLEKGLKNSPTNANLLYQLAFVSDSYYEDKKIALKRYEKYILKYGRKKNQEAAYAKQRIKEIRKTLFIKGEKAD